MAIIMKAKPVVEEMFKNWEPHSAYVTIFSNSEDEASNIYVNNKVKKFKEYNINIDVIDLNKLISKWEICAYVEVKNKTGIKYMFQKPYPKEFEDICEGYSKIIPKSLDMDATSIENTGLFYQKPELNNSPCTPWGIKELLDYYIPEETLKSGLNAVIIGRSEIVGRPLARILEYFYNMTVTICHSKTKDISKYTKDADLIVSAVGRMNMITADMVNENAIIVDVGINRDENGKVKGDCDYANLKDKVYAITPVPGGVGPMTVATLVYKTGEKYE